MDVHPFTAIQLANAFKAKHAGSHQERDGDSRIVRIPGDTSGSKRTPPGAAGNYMKHLPILIAAAVVALSFFPSSPRPAVTGPVAVALQSASSADRARVRGIYLALADITARDAGRQIATLADWRSVHASELRLAVGETGLVGKYAGLDKAVEEVLLSEVGGLDNATMDATTVAKVVAGCKKVAAQSE